MHWFQWSTAWWLHSQTKFILPSFSIDMWYRHLPEVQTYCYLPRNFLSVALVPALPGVLAHSSMLFHSKCLHYSSSYLQRFSKCFSLPGNNGDPGSLLISTELHDVWHKTQYYHSDGEKLCSLDLRYIRVEAFMKNK